MPVGRVGGARRRWWWRQGGCRPSTSLFAGCLTPLHPTRALHYAVVAYWWQPAHNQVPYVWTGHGKWALSAHPAALPAVECMAVKQAGTTTTLHHLAARYVWEPKVEEGDIAAPSAAGRVLPAGGTGGTAGGTAGGTPAVASVAACELLRSLSRTHTTSGMIPGGLLGAPALGESALTLVTCGAHGLRAALTQHHRPYRRSEEHSWP